MHGVRSRGAGELKTHGEKGGKGWSETEIQAGQRE